ncbi:metallophosphoesterase, partial [Mycolicibacterium sp.]|uniref:metallophosphoesterase n=1 Tax=Mycolicibacterium sp. TaxID=2320850 RepID=UPI0025CB865C
MTGYDIIGDIHGCADPLESLLDAMGYRYTDGAFRHPSRQAVFVGDLVDRGPQQLRVLETVKAMVDAGSAQITMGNHEFNAICYCIPRADGDYLRRHSDKNAHQHRASNCQYLWIGVFQATSVPVGVAGLSAGSGGV